MAHPTTGKSPSFLLMNRQIRLKIPAVKSGEVNAATREEVRRKVEEVKVYADKHRKEKVIKTGDKVLIKQEKTTVKLYKVTNIKWTKRGGKTKKNVDKVNVIKDKPVELIT